MTSLRCGVHGVWGRVVAVAAVSTIHDLLLGGVHGVWERLVAVAAVGAAGRGGGGINHHDLLPRRADAVAAV